MSSVFHIWTIWTFQLHYYIVGYGYDDWNISGLDRTVYIGFWVPIVAVDYISDHVVRILLPTIDDQLFLRYQLGSDAVSILF